jgi:hypothetical protein
MKKHSKRIKFYDRLAGCYVVLAEHIVKQLVDAGLVSKRDIKGEVK